MRKTSMGKLLGLALVLAVLVLGCALAVSAEDLQWNLLTDKDAGYVAQNAGGNFTMATEEDGTVYVHNLDSGRAGAYYVYDDNNLLGEYRSFSLEGDFYFESLPSGLRTDQNPPVTANEMPLSFLAWCYKHKDTGAIIWNSLRISGDGELYLANGKTAGVSPSGIYLEVGKWYNVKILMMPANGLCELYVNGKKEADFNIVRFDDKIHESYFVRYFDGYFEWDVKMKNLIVKTDSSYIIGLREEEAADFIGYQTSKVEADGFSLRAVMGVNSTDYNRIGYEVVTLARDGEGKVVSEAISQRSKVVYTSVKDNEGNIYNIKDLYGYEYAAALEIESLPATPPHGSLEIVIRPYVLGMDGIRLYGDPAILLYSGDTDSAGMPKLMRITDRYDVVLPIADTFIYKWANSGNNFGAKERLQLQNTDVTNANPTQAAYFKFHFTPEQVKMIENSSSARLCLYQIGMESVELLVYGSDTAWDEMTITYDNHTETAKVQEYITSAVALDRQYVYFDVLRYLSEQMLNEDGSLTVSFRVIPKGEEGAKATYVEAREKSAETTPKIEIVTTIYEAELGLRKISNAGYEPWGYAEHLVNEWFDVLVDKVYPKDANGNVILYDVNENVPEGYGATEASGDFTAVVEWDANNYIWIAPNHWADHPDGVLREDEWEKDHFARTLSTLGTSTANAYLSSEYAEVKSEYDVYGGITNAGFKGQTTGFFHTERIGGRTYIIDPLGNPYFAVGIDDFTMYNEQYIYDVYDSKEAYYEGTTALLKEMGINTAHVSQKERLLAVEDGLSVVVDLSVVGAYMFSLGRSQISEGQFPHNNTINVFDPDFKKMTNKNVAAEILANGYAENPRVLGYTTDNELPGGNDILTRYLTLNTDEPSNSFSYAVAWTWLARRMNTPAPTLAEYLEAPDILEMNSEFLSFIYATYYGVSREAIEAVDPNHMYIGSRVASNCRFDEGYLRAAGYYLEIITTNLYTGLHFPWDALTNYYRYAGKPFLITEFYAKAMDAIDDNGFIMANSTGAGSIVKTQQDRAEYYEHQAMILLESNACVGWTWYRMLDNDQPLHYSIDLEKEVVMAYVSYGQYPEPRSFIDREGNIYTAAEVNFYETIDKGDAMASNHNCNKGVFNRNYTSTVAVYSYDATGKLLGSKSYHVEHPDEAIPADGTVLVALDGSQHFTIGTVTNADGSYTATELTTFKGTYVALARAMRNISDNLIGLVKYFDAQ